MPDAQVRPATEADLAAIAAVSTATGEADDWAGTNPAYIRHLMDHGRVVVAELNSAIAGFGAVQTIGSGQDAVTMLCDLFVDPAAHGRGLGRAMLSDLFSKARRRMTFSSLHAHAMPLYTSFGLDAWWPLLYLGGDVGKLPVPPDADWVVEHGSADQVARHELGWTGADRTAEHRAWAARPGGESVVVSRDSDVFAAAAVIGSGLDRGIVHMAVASHADDGMAAAAVLMALAQLEGPPEETAHVCLPAPHPAVRALLAAGWRFNVFDVFMASEPGLIDPRRAVPSPGQA